MTSSVRHVLPNLVTNTELEAVVDRLKRAIEQTAHQQSVRFFGMLLSVVGLMHAILFALVRLVN